MKTKIICSLFALFLLQGVVRSQTIDELYAIAADSNREVRASFEEFQSSMQRAAQVSGLSDPVLSFGYFIQPVETRVGPQSAKIGLTQMFPWFGTLKSQENSASSFAEAKYQTFLDKQKFLFVEIAESYYPLLELQEQIKLQEENLKILKSYLAIAKSSYSNGKSSMVDILRVEIEIENAKTDLLLLEEEIEPYRVRLSNILNWPNDTLYTINEKFEEIALSKELAEKPLFNEHPTVLALKQQMESAKHQEQAAKKQGAPKIGVGLDYIFIDKSNSINSSDNGKDAIMPMVSVSIPLYRKKYKAAILEANHKQKALAYHIENKENDLSSKYSLYWYQLTNAYEKHALYEQQLKLTQQAINLTLNEYSNSGKDYEELLRLQQKLLKYKEGQLVQMREYSLAKTKLNYLQSK